MPSFRSPRYLQLHQPDDALLAQEAAQGLMQPVAGLSPKFLYDPLGSRLFEAITVLQEYYLTRTEADIMAESREDIAREVGRVLPEMGALVDLGAGNCAKAADWFQALAPRRYVAVDISIDFLRDALEEQARRHPSIDMTGIGMDFSSRLAFPAGELPEACLMFYPGSSIGNFSPAQALSLLSQARHEARGGALLIGVDLVKSDALLVPAYDDMLGVTAAFNLNLLLHLNRILGANFDPRDWMHVALYSHQHARIEMHLQARRPVTVRWPGHLRHFESGERIHTENSFKWTLDGFEALLRSAGYQRVQHWCDPRQWFGVFLASA
ncbi:MAG: L-histidine N(alpha)-methyltransferase [Burkholderiaceae bacterium]